MTGWIAASFFVEGLSRVDGVVTWAKFIDAMESAPINNPFGGVIDYANGARLGTQEMNLSKVMPSTTVVGEGVWTSVEPLASISSILGS